MILIVSLFLTARWLRVICEKSSLCQIYFAMDPKQFEALKVSCPGLKDAHQVVQYISTQLDMKPSHDNMTPLKLSQTREILSSRSARCLPLWSIGTGGTSGTVVPCKSQWDWQENLWDFMKTEHLVSNGDSLQWSNNIDLKCCLPVHAMLRELFTRKGMLQVHL